MRRHARAHCLKREREGRASKIRSKEIEEKCKRSVREKTNETERERENTHTHTS